MKAYISISFNQRKDTEMVVAAIRSALKELKIEPFVFVDDYRFSPAEEKAMMEQCMNDIDRCDLLVAEFSDKAIGVGIEIGYAKAKNKPVLYLRHKSAKHSTTASGLSDYAIIYENEEMLRLELKNALNIRLLNR